MVTEMRYIFCNFLKPTTLFIIFINQVLFTLEEVLYYVLTHALELIN